VVYRWTSRRGTIGSTHCLPLRAETHTRDCGPALLELEPQKLARCVQYTLLALLCAASAQNLLAVVRVVAWLRALIRQEARRSQGRKRRRIQKRYEVLFHGWGDCLLVRQGAADRELPEGATVAGFAALRLARETQDAQTTSWDTAELRWNHAPRYYILADCVTAQEAVVQPGRSLSVLMTMDHLLTHGK
jgi:hypothetical protein